MANSPAFRLLLITDRKRAALPLLELVEAALSAAPSGSIAIQLREKDLEARLLVELARELMPICRVHQAALLVNDRIDVALALELDGVHLPQASFKANDARQLLGPNKLIGVSCHSLEEVREAKEQGASYATFGPVFDTPSKRGFGPPVGLERLRSASTLGLPLYGLGGVTSANARQVTEHGGWGAAAIGAWLAAPRPAEAVSSLLVSMLGTEA